ncbi:MAG: adenylate/guanylate cyclase domain-containing protein [Pseudobdellovibrionaceae bacterium]
MKMWPLSDQLKLKTQFKPFSSEMKLKVVEMTLFTDKVAAILHTLLILFILLHWLPVYSSVQSDLYIYLTILYLPILFLRINWAWKKSITTQIATLFTLFDVTIMVLLTILSLKASNLSTSTYYSLTAHNFFILLIAIRALSLSSSLVMLTTLSTIGAQTLLIVYQIKSSVFIETELLASFLQSEVQKILVLTASGGLMAFLIYILKSLMSQSEANNNMTENLSRFFSPQVADMIRSGELEIKAGKGNKKKASVLFLDLRAFTKVSQSMDPDHVMSLLNEYHKRVIPIILRNNGVVDKFLGDGVLAHFGAIVENNTHAKNCMNTIEEILFEMDSWNYDRRRNAQPEIEVNMAADSGLIIFGATGDKDRLEMTIIGSAVNTAAKLEKHNKQLKSTIAITEALMKATQQQGHKSPLAFEYAQGKVVDGLEENINIFYIPKKRAISIVA